MNLIDIENVNLIYGDTVKTKGLNNISFNIKDGEFVAIMGPSGSGKSTLLNVVSGILRVSSGKIIVSGKDISKLDDRQSALFRRDYLGFVFQDFNLVETLTVKENIMLPLMFQEVNEDEMTKSAIDLAKILGIDAILEKNINEISGGQAQRVAIARAIIHKPALVLADEPTGNLDSKSSKDVMKIFKELNEKLGVTILLVTHDAFTASYSKRTVFIKDGEIYNEIYKGHDEIEFRQNILNVLEVIGGE